MRRLMIVLVILLVAGAGLAIAQTGGNNSSIVKSYLNNVSTQLTGGVKDVTASATAFRMPCAQAGSVPTCSQTGSGMPCAQASSRVNLSK